MRARFIFSLFFVFTLVSSSLANADGFLCTGQNSGVSIKVFNHTEISLGTRTPAVMVISDPTKAIDDQTIALFSGEQNTLTYQGHGTYLATVNQDAGQSTAVIAGTELGQLNTIELLIDFSYNPPVTTLAGAVSSIPGKIQYLKISGETLVEDVSCTRYLKTR